MINPLGAATSLPIVRGTVTDSPGSVPNIPHGPGATGGFGSMMTSIIKDTVQSLQVGEATAISGMQKQVPLQQVVEAMMQAEQSLHAAVVVRDKVVGAYLEISRMQI